MSNPTLHEVTVLICSLCLDGAGGECHTPGCVMWLNRAPDLPILDHPCLLMLDGQPGPAYLDESDARPAAKATP